MKAPVSKKPAKKPSLGIVYTCQKCRKEVSTTRSREIYTKNFVGPCGDSFCYASCDSSSCRSIRVTVCDGCEEKLKR